MPCRSGASAPRQWFSGSMLKSWRYRSMPCSVSRSVHMVGEPLPGVVVAEIEQAALVAAENPFRMVLRQPRAGGHPLRLEPDEDLDALAVGVIGDGPQPAREPRGVHLPRADAGPAAAMVHVPAGVHPPVVELDVLLEVAVDEQDLPGLVGVDHLVVLARAGGEQLRLGQDCRRAWASSAPSSSDARRSGRRSSRLSRTAARSAGCGLPRPAAA